MVENIVCSLFQDPRNGARTRRSTIAINTPGFGGDSFRHRRGRNPSEDRLVEAANFHGQRISGLAQPPYCRSRHLRGDVPENAVRHTSRFVDKKNHRLACGPVLGAFIARCNCCAPSASVNISSTESMRELPRRVNVRATPKSSVESVSCVLANDWGSRRSSDWGSRRQRWCGCDCARRCGRGDLRGWWNRWRRCDANITRLRRNGNHCSQDPSNRVTLYGFENHQPWGDRIFEPLVCGGVPSAVVWWVYQSVQVLHMDPIEQVNERARLSWNRLEKNHTDTPSSIDKLLSCNLDTVVRTNAGRLSTRFLRQSICDDDERPFIRLGHKRCVKDGVSCLAENPPDGARTRSSAVAVNLPGSMRNPVVHGCGRDSCVNRLVKAENFHGQGASRLAQPPLCRCRNVKGDIPQDVIWDTP